MSTQFRRSLPANPDFDQQKKLARELLRAYQAGEAEADARVRDKLPDKPRIVLADAQYVLAREYGFDSWTALKNQIGTRGSAKPLDAIRNAVRNRDVKTIRTLLERHPEIRSLLNEPLFAFDAPALVAFSDDREMVQLLLEFGADPNRRSAWWAGGFHPLHGASNETAPLLLEAGAIPDACAAAHLGRVDLLEQMLQQDPARVHERGGDGQTPLHFARTREVVDLLLAAGADPDARDVDHRATPAQWMLDHRKAAGRYDLAAYLVSRGASADIFLAAALGLSNRVRELLEGNPALLEERTGHGDYGEQPPSSYHIYTWAIGGDRSPMQVAAQFEQHETLAVMRTFATPRQQLLAALANGDAQEAQALLRAHAALLESLTAEDKRLLPEAAWNANARAVRLMLDLGFDPATRNADGANALHCAAWEGSTEIVREILNRGDASLIHERDTKFGGTALGWCNHGSCHGPRDRDHAGVARLLLEAGVEAPDEFEASDAVRSVIESWTRSH